MFKSKGFLFLVFLIIFALVLGIGYFFAKKKSEPIYESKIDKIIYEKKNKSPNFVMTLPDRETPHATVVKDTQEPEAPKKEEPKALDANELLNQIPLAAKLPKIAAFVPMKDIQADETLLKKTDDGVLPAPAVDGRKPWSEYGRMVEVQPQYYKVGIVISDVGLDSFVTTTVIESMPSNISLSFTPYTPDLDKAIKNARSFGHETYLDLLLPSKDFLKADNGPMAMSLSQRVDDNIKRMQKTLNVQAPVGGMIIQRGMIDADSPQRVLKLLNEIKKMGLLAIDATDDVVLDTVATSGLPRQKADIVIDSNFSREEIDKKLAEAEEIARDTGSVLIVVIPKPVVLHAINDWVNSFSPQITEYEQVKNTVIEKPLVLVPISNLVVE